MGRRNSGRPGTVLLLSDRNRRGLILKVLTGFFALSWLV